MTEPAIDETNIMRDYALHYSQTYGWPVFPCHSIRDDKCTCGKEDCTGKNRGKHPRTKNGLHDATTNEEQIRRWWTKWPDANIGIQCGVNSGLIVLDVDGDEGKLSLSNYPELPATYTVRTGNGVQYYFKHPGGIIKTVPGVLPGLDSRGDKNGYVIAPPSIHYSGRRYEVTNDAPPAEAPAWWVSLLEEPELQPRSTPQLVDVNATGDNPKYVAAAFKNELDRLAQASEGQRNHQLNKSAFAIGRFVGAGYISETDAESELTRVAHSIGLNGHETARTIQSGLTKGKDRPANVPTIQPKRQLRGGQVRAYIQGASEEEAESEDGSEDADADQSHRAGSYTVTYGRTHLVIEKTGKDGQTISTTPPVWDGAAHIVEEITDESGQTLYRVEGRTRSGRRFEVEIEAAKFADARQLMAILSNFAGADCVFAAGMEKHLGPSIKSFTNREELEFGRRFNRVGWFGDGEDLEYLIPGREAEHTAIHLSRKLPYRIDSDADVEAGIVTLRDVIRAQKAEATTVAVTVAFQAPLARFAHWRDERYALFIAGRTGSFKSAWSMAMMPLWGVGFSSEDQVIKMGDGGTNNARMDFLARANDAPLLFDNYKPNTGKGAAELINLIHLALEGGEKDRLNRNNSQRDTRVVHAWPIFTGEDFPDTDASVTARTLILWFPYTGEANEHLTKAQAGARHLSAVTGAWLDWLVTPDAQTIIRTQAACLTDRRTYWASVLRRERGDMANINRVATNLSTNEITWRIMEACPMLQGICREFKSEYYAGLQVLARDMAHRAAESSESNRYIEALRSLLATKRLLLMPRVHDIPDDARTKYLGWEDEKGVYVVPEIAHREIQDLLKDGNTQTALSKNAIHKQLVQINALASVGKDGPVIVKRCGNSTHRVLHFKPELFATEEEAED